MLQMVTTMGRFVGAYCSVQRSRRGVGVVARGVLLTTQPAMFSVNASISPSQVSADMIAMPSEASQVRQRSVVARRMVPVGPVIPDHGSDVKPVTVSGDEREAHGRIVALESFMPPKILSRENWRDPDLYLAHFVPTGSDLLKTCDDRAARILAIELEPSVPEKVRELFNVARGAMVSATSSIRSSPSGWIKSSEWPRAAVTSKCASISAIPKSAKTYEKKLDALLAQVVLKAPEHFRWHALRGLRNETSHPKGQWLDGPPSAIPMLGTIAEDINSLFR